MDNYTIGRYHQIWTFIFHIKYFTLSTEIILMERDDQGRNRQHNFAIIDHHVHAAPHPSQFNACIFKGQVFFTDLPYHTVHWENQE